jgi:integrase
MSSKSILTRRRQTNSPPTVTQENPPDRVPRWRVELRPNGRRKRHFFSTEQEALQFAAKEHNRTLELGRRAEGVSGALLEDALRAEEILSRFPGITLLDTAEFYAKTHDRKSQSKTAREVADDLIQKTKSNGYSTVHCIDLEARLDKFCERFGSTLMAEITTQDIEGWLAGLAKKYSPQSIVNFHRTAKQLFSHAVPRGYCAKNLLDAIDKPKIAPKDEVGIFSPEELQAILSAADAKILPWLAIGAFAGLRTAEIDRLHWEDLNFERGLIEIKAAKAKTAKRRLVPITPALAAWLSPYKTSKGQIRPKNFHNRRRHAYKAAGFSTACCEPKGERDPDKKLRPAPANALRHSFASYRFSDTNNAAQTAVELGHTSTALLFSTYRELVSPEQAKKYWDIRPQKAQPATNSNVS